MFFLRSTGRVELNIQNETEMKQSLPMKLLTLKPRLSIVLITFNRDKLLQRTLTQIFAENSPLKNLKIHILDNGSTDKTPSICSYYKEIFPNLSYSRNALNAGGNANICKAFEIGFSVPSEYIWVLCDDDFYDFSHWKEVEEGLEKDPDVLLVERKIDFKTISTDLTPYFINTMAFVPAGIYHKRCFSSTVLQNMYINLYTGMPHLAIGCGVLNRSGKILYTDHPIIKQELRFEFSRGTDKFIHHRQIHCNLFSAFIASYALIKNKQLRRECCNVLWVGKSFFYSMYKFWKSNGLYPHNVSEVFLGVDFKGKILFLLSGVAVIYLKLYRKIRENF